MLTIAERLQRIQASLTADEHRPPARLVKCLRCRDTGWQFDENDRVTRCPNGCEVQHRPKRRDAKTTRQEF